MIIDSFIKGGAVFTHLGHIETEHDLIKRGKRIIDNVPVPNTLRIGQEPIIPFTIASQEFEEGLALWRDNQDADEAILDSKSYIEDPMTIGSRLYMEGKIFAQNNYFFNNNKVGGPIADMNGFIGIKYRMMDNAKYGTNPGCKFVSTSSLLDADLSSAGAVKLTRDMKRMFNHMGSRDGANITIFCNDQAIRQFAALLESAGTAGGLRIDKDAFDRVIMKFMEATIVSCGFLPPLVGGLQTAPIIDSAQDVNGLSVGDPGYAGTGGGSYTSMYFVMSGPKDFMVWQQADPMIRKEKVSGTRTIRVLYDHTQGLFQPNSRAVGWLYGVKCNGVAGD